MKNTLLKVGWVMLLLIWGAGVLGVGRVAYLITARVDSEKQMFLEVPGAVHSEMSTGQADAIYMAADRRYQAAVGRADSNAAFRHISDYLGQPTKPKFEVITDLPGFDNGKSYRVRFSTQFSNGNADEEMDIHYDSNVGRFRLLRYSVLSPLLEGGRLSLPGVSPP